MKARTIRECDMFGRALIFWKTNNADIPAGSKGATYYATLGTTAKNWWRPGPRKRAAR